MTSLFGALKNTNRLTINTIVNDRKRNFNVNIFEKQKNMLDTNVLKIY